MPVPIAGGRHRVHRKHLVAGGHQRGHEQAPVGLDPDHHLDGLFGVVAHHLVEPGDALHPFGQPATGQTLAVRILDEHIVVGFRPVHSNKDPHPRSSPSTVTPYEPEDSSSFLMD